MGYLSACRARRGRSSGMSMPGALGLVRLDSPGTGPGGRLRSGPGGGRLQRSGWWSLRGVDLGPGDEVDRTVVLLAADDQGATARQGDPGGVEAALGHQRRRYKVVEGRIIALCRPGRS